jgi:hypothetical protein
MSWAHLQAELKPANALLLLDQNPLRSDREGPGGLHEAETALAGIVMDRTMGEEAAGIEASNATAVAQADGIRFYP